MVIYGLGVLILIGIEEGEAVVPQVLVDCSTTAVSALQPDLISLHGLQIAFLPRILVPSDDDCLVVLPEKEDRLMDSALGKEKGLKRNVNVYLMAKGL